MPEAGASMAIVDTRASGVARPIAIAVNTRYPTCVYKGAPTAVTGVQKCYFVFILQSVYSIIFISIHPTIAIIALQLSVLGCIITLGSIH